MGKVKTSISLSEYTRGDFNSQKAQITNFRLIFGLWGLE